MACIVAFCTFESISLNSYLFLKQIKNIPNGSTFSKLFSNIYFHYYENSYLEYSNIADFIYIADTLVFSNDNFESINKEIYPAVLNIKKSSVAGES